jgi:hypothetical protein
MPSQFVVRRRKSRVGIGYGLYQWWRRMEACVSLAPASSERGGVGGRGLPHLSVQSQVLPRQSRPARCPISSPGYRVTPEPIGRRQGLAIRLPSVCRVPHHGGATYRGRSEREAVTTRERLVPIDKLARARPRGELGPQLTAFFTSAPIRASVSGVSAVSAKEVGHMAPSSRCASSLKPRVAYRELNLEAAVK